MKEQLRMLGIWMGMEGTRLIEDLMDDKLNLADLTYKQIKAILAAWETRHYVPADKKEFADKVSPTITRAEVAQGLYTQEEYDRDYVKMIIKYINTIN